MLELLHLPAFQAGTNILVVDYQSLVRETEKLSNDTPLFTDKHLTSEWCKLEHSRALQVYKCAFANKLADKIAYVCNISNAFLFSTFIMDELEIQN